MSRQRAINLVLMCFFAFAGGMASEWVSQKSVATASADNGSETPMRSFRDINGNVRMNLGVQNNQPIEELWGEDGKPRLQLGTYDGSVDATEKGLPVTAFYDNEGRIKMLMRLAAGKNQAPVLIMKDNKGKDRLIMGLAFDDPSEDPFMVYYDSKGEQHTVFGSFK